MNRWSTSSTAAFRFLRMASSTRPQQATISSLPPMSNIMPLRLKIRSCSTSSHRLERTTSEIHRKCKGKVHMKLAIPTLIASATLVCFCSHADAETSLRSPWDRKHVQITGASYDCPSPVHLSPDLTTDGFYSDSKSSVIDPEKWKAYTESSGTYKELGNRVVAAADAFQSTGSRAAAQCVLDLLNTAASDGVFTGKMSSRQAYYVQGWVIGALAIAFLKVRGSGLVHSEEMELLTRWMK